MHLNLKTKKIGMIGMGNMGQAVVKGILSAEIVNPENIYISNITDGILNKYQEKYGVNPVTNNEELIDECDVVIIGIKPQDFYNAIEPISSSFTNDQVLISICAGLDISSIRKVVGEVGSIVRVMPNTAARIGQAIVGYCTEKADSPVDDMIEALLSPLGEVVKLDEDEEFRAFTVGAGSGIGFVFELMLYWQDWLEQYGFSPEEAKLITVRTFKGASMLAEAEDGVSIQELQNQVVSKKGVTHSGLSSMRETEIERSLRISFEKAAMRDQELSK